MSNGNANGVKRSTWRRTIAICCALAFLLVGFAHTVHHFAEFANPANVEVSAAAPADGGADPVKSSHGSAEHCHGCVMTALTGQEIVLDAPDVPELWVISAVDIRQPCPLSENPPPIASI